MKFLSGKARATGMFVHVSSIALCLSPAISHDKTANMKTRPFSLALVCLLAGASCTSPYRVQGARAALADGGNVTVSVAPGDSVDELALSTVEEELSKRGFSIVNRHSARITVTMADAWRWDEIMFL